ncbi:MAG: primosomal protein N' (replication factor Y) - superfamily II helicase [Proteobacteria bacterium]|nr:primosomal protein N' (replication factor Y) - superfamily II helicase [Pseudomonadota bacterium]MBS0574149.1 primosomal protein N' (replication factor Y) - superfamily II helicase [Pseudomonadota bacterium]
MMQPSEGSSFPCATCGAALRFSPEYGGLVCDHCGNREPLPAGPVPPGSIPETAFRAGIEAQLPEAATELRRLGRCPNCGAEVGFDAAVHSSACPFCATPIVAGPDPARRIRPHAVAPFAVTGAAARAAMQRWLGGLWFAPSGLAAFARGGRALEGVYVPYWTFDAQTRTAYSGRRGTVCYETRPVTVRDAAGAMRTELRQVARVSWSAASGQVQRAFDDVLVLASHSLPEGHTEALLPWDLSLLQPYQPEFLAGFRSEAYSVTPDQGMGEARAYMDRMIDRDIRFDIGGDRQEVLAAQTEVSGQTFKHVLLPVWTAAYRFRGQSFRFVVNGQTGKVEGERPWSWVKIAAFFLALALLFGGGAWLMQNPDLLPWGQGQTPP